MANEDSNFELIDGGLFIHLPASREDEEIFQYLMSAFVIYLGKTHEGKIYGSRLVMRLSKTWNPEPDLMILLPEHYDKIEDTRINGAADLAIEILSKSTRELDLTKKVPKYLESGVQEVWIIDPYSKTIQMYWSNGMVEYDTPDSEESLSSQIFPQLNFKIKWLWSRDEFPVDSITDFLVKNS